ncbi:MAG: hypothetical protein GY913_05545 [Proteobacteria bacterium]|nr:hypothetical protein [Pseudomonadota bacterium]MCP4916367.1 hypothetical protein [Pseudomonadota bacterium]
MDLLEGTLVHGEILDAQTGEPVAGVTVAAVALEGSRPTSAGRGLSDEDGLYAIQGLPPGEIQVFLPTDPLDRASGVLDEELALDLVRSPPGDVSTRRGADGSLWVTGLGDDAPDGLEAGDRIEAVELFGVDPNELIPGAGDALLDVLAGASDLPGVTLVVGRDGEFWELD